LDDNGEKLAIILSSDELNLKS